MPAARTEPAVAFRRHAGSFAVALSSLSAACSGPDAPKRMQDPNPRQEPPGYGMRQPAGQGRWGERFVVEGSVLPAVWLTVDTDDGSTPSDATTGVGASARAAIGNRDQSIGLLLQGVDFSGDDAFSDGSVEAAFVDFDVRVPTQDAKWLQLVVGAGFGVARFDSGLLGAGAETEGAAQLRLGLEFVPVPAVALGIGGGGVAYGHPGDTAAYGTFLQFGLTITF